MEHKIFLKESIVSKEINILFKQEITSYSIYQVQVEAIVYLGVRSQLLAAEEQ